MQQKSSTVQIIDPNKVGVLENARAFRVFLNNLMFC